MFKKLIVAILSGLYVASNLQPDIIPNAQTVLAGLIFAYCVVTLIIDFLKTIFAK